MRKLPLMFVFTGLLLFNGWVYVSLQDARLGASDAVAGADDANVLAEKISSLRNRQSVATVRVVSESDLIRRVEQASQSAQIPASKLLRITPESPRRFQDSAYLEQPISLSFQEITLSQLLGCLLELCDKNEGLTIQNLRLTAPRDGTAQELWKSEATISYWIYSPKSDSSKTANNL